jgi:hypothetical protein
VTQAILDGVQALLSVDNSKMHIEHQKIGTIAYLLQAINQSLQMHEVN